MDAQADADPSSDGRCIEVLHDGERLALAIDGAVQSVSVVGGGTGGGYWAAMLPDRAPRDALLLGLGGGTLAHLLTQVYGPLPLVGVDDDADVVSLGRAHFGLDLPNLQIEIADAYAFAATCPRRFDFVAIDLYRDGQIAPRATEARFLRDLVRLLRPEGTAAFNLARDRRAGNRLSQIGRHLVLQRRLLVGFNLVVHCQSGPVGAPRGKGRPVRRGARDRRR